MDLRNSASVLCLRNGNDGVEVLVVHRKLSRSAAANVWAFPGGGVEPIDGDDGDDPWGSARLAAAKRETLEEVNLELLNPLFPISHWITPTKFDIRFDTSFYAVEIGDASEVTILDSELDDSKWVNVKDFRGSYDITNAMPPTFWNCWLLGFELQLVGEVIQYVERQRPIDCRPLWNEQIGQPDLWEALPKR